MLGLANVCELAEIHKNVWMDILGGRMGNKPGKNPLNFILGLGFAVSEVQLCSFYLGEVS